MIRRFKANTSFRYIFSPYSTFVNIFCIVETPYILKQGTSWNKLELPGMSWNYLEQAFTTQNHLVIVTKRTVLEVYRQKHLEQNGTSNELTQIKILIGQCCVYNIIRLQNITLQIPIFRKSSIFDVGKVSQIWLCFIYFK